MENKERILWIVIVRHSKISDMRYYKTYTTLANLTRLTCYLQEHFKVLGPFDAYEFQYIL